MNWKINLLSLSSICNWQFSHSLHETSHPTPKTLNTPGCWGSPVNLSVYISHFLAVKLLNFRESWVKYNIKKCDYVSSRIKKSFLIIRYSRKLQHKILLFFYEIVVTLSRTAWWIKRFAACPNKRHSVRSSFRVGSNTLNMLQYLNTDENKHPNIFSLQRKHHNIFSLTWGR